MSKILASEVSDIIKACLTTQAELDVIPDGTVCDECLFVEGVVRQFSFDSSRIKEHRNQILDILENIDDDFSDPEAGGTSFLKLPFDNNEAQWGEQQNAEELMVLGIAIGAIELLGPREMWQMMPGGMPYLKLNTRKGNALKRRINGD